jgi:hypothetical protein
LLQVGDQEDVEWVQGQVLVGFVILMPRKHLVVEEHLSQPYLFQPQVTPSQSVGVVRE